jgi:ketosteroid isomerase-like protein
MSFHGAGHFAYQEPASSFCPQLLHKRSSLWRTCILLISICTIAAYALAQSEADAATKARIVTLETLWYESFKDKDTKAIDSILDSTVLLVNSDGSTQTKGDYLAGLKVSFAQASYQESQTIPEMMSVKVFGTTAIATGVYQIKGIHNGKPFVRHERFIDTWKYRAGLWLIVGTQATPVLH